MKILGLIPARGGSKGVVRKNIRLLSGKPLLAYTAENALAAKSLTRLILSTEDSEIAEIGKKYGLEVPFMRPPELASDTTPTLPVVQHALKFLENKGAEFDAVCLLQPTNPLRRAEDIDGAAELLEKSGASAVVGILPVPLHYHPHWIYFADEKGRIKLASGESEPTKRRQDLPSAFHRDGSIYLTRTEVILQENSLYGAKVQGFEMNPEFSINIDTEEDWLKAERI